MTLTTTDFLDAAFWHDYVCLDCGNVQEEAGECEVCQSERVLPAETVRDCHAFVEGLEE